MLYISYLLITGVSAAILTGLGLYAATRRHMPVAKWFALVMVVSLVWLLAYAAAVVDVHLDTKILAIQIVFTASVALPLVWLILVLTMTGHERWLTWRRAFVLGLVPMVITAFNWTNADHTWFIYDFRLVDFGPARYSGGPGLNGLVFYTLVGYSAAIVVLARAMRDAFTLDQRRYVLTIIAILIPCTLDTLYYFGIMPFTDISPAPSALGVSGLLLAWAVFNYHLLDVRQIARGLVIENLQDPLFVVDAQDRLVDVNPIAQRIFSVDPVIAVGKPIQELLAAIPDILAWYQRAEPQGEVTCHIANTPKIYSTRINPIFDHDDHMIGRMVILHDDTERKILESERAKFFLGIEKSPEPIMLCRADGVIEYVNLAFEQTYGYPKAEVVGKTPDILKSGLTAAHVHKIFGDALNAKQVAQVEFINKTRDGHLVTVEESVTPILDDLGNVQSFLSVQRNVTERKQAERLLRESEDKLRSFIEQTTDGIILVDESARVIE